jgi:hypothetical protein
MRETSTTVRDVWTAWPVSWSAVWVGALASVVAVILFGLAGTAFGAYKAGAAGRITSFSGIGLAALVFAVFGSFLSFVIGGWIAARIAGIQRAEPAMLHGAITFLLGTVTLVALASFGGAVTSGWYVALAPSPAAPAQVGQAVDPNAAKAAAAGAAAAATALLIGLVGGVVGGWMASGEPMTFTHYRTRSMSSRTTATERTTRI